MIILYNPMYTINKKTVSSIIYGIFAIWQIIWIWETFNSFSTGIFWYLKTSKYF